MKSKTAEETKDVVGYEGIYTISSNGILLPYNNKRGTKGMGSKDDKGYLRAGLRKDKIAKTFQIHRLVAIAFIPNPENKPQVNHKNGIKHDNRVVNLEWCTQVENSLHAVKIGLCDCYLGNNNNKSKINESEIPFIRSSNLSNCELGRMYGVSPNAIRFIKIGKNWKQRAL